MRYPYDLDNNQQRMVYDFISETLSLIKNNHGCYFEEEHDIVCEDECCVGCGQARKLRKIFDTIKDQQALRIASKRLKSKNIKSKNCTMWAFGDCMGNKITKSKLSCCSFCHDKYYGEG